MKKFLEFLIGAVATVILGVALAVFALEWMAGCGETYIDSKGIRHQNECLFFNHQKGN